MKGKRFLSTGLAMALALALIAGLALAQQPAGSPLTAAFTYQGRLSSSGIPYTGPCDLQFGLWDAGTGGAQIGPTQTLTNVPLADGYFTVQLDWGADKFFGEQRWLDISVCCPAGGGTYTPLTPRQMLTAAPQALFAMHAPWPGLVDVPPGFADGIDNDTLYGAGPGLTISGTIFAADTAYLQRRVIGACGSGFAIRGVNQDGSVTCEPVGGGGGDAWLLTGNSGTTPGTNYLGTSDNVALELRVNGERALRLEPTSTSPNLVGGRPGNWLTSGVYGATIGGGGVTGDLNRVTDSFGTVGGGAGNQAGDNAGATDDATYATVGGGQQNSVSATYATVGGGWGNAASGEDATIGGGYYNAASGGDATIGGGFNNLASASCATVGGGLGNTASGEHTAIGGGYTNTASGDSATVGGGEDNEASADHATVGGGITNTVSAEFATVGGGMMNTASGMWSVIAGGSENQASDLWATVSGGTSNYATGANATVGGGGGNWASGSDSTIAGGYGNVASGTQATVCGGGENTAAGLWSFAAGKSAKANSRGCFVWGDSSNPDITCNTEDRWVARASGGVYFYTDSGATTGSYLAAGSGTWTQLSDRALKENVAEVDTHALLAKLAQVPVTTWSYTSEDPAIRHMGPMAQDFYAAFGLGDSETHITTIDADGVALAAIQGLYAENRSLKAQVGDLEARLAALEKAQAPARTGAALPWLLIGGVVVAGGTLAARRRPGGGR